MTAEKARIITDENSLKKDDIDKLIFEAASKGLSFVDIDINRVDNPILLLQEYAIKYGFRTNHRQGRFELHW